MSTNLTIREIQDLEKVPDLDFSELGKTQDEMIEDLAAIAVAGDYQFFMKLLDEYAGDLEKRENHFFRIKCFELIANKKKELEQNASN